MYEMLPLFFVMRKMLLSSTHLSTQAFTLFLPLSVTCMKAAPVLINMIYYRNKPGREDVQIFHQGGKRLNWLGKTSRELLTLKPTSRMTEVGLCCVTERCVSMSA